jgi:hypothetical protein
MYTHLAGLDSFGLTGVKEIVFADRGVNLIQNL